MGRSMACLLASSVIVAVLTTLSGGVEAAAYPTVTKACKEVADSDKRISYAFCVAELSRHYQPGSDEIAGGAFYLMARSAISCGAENADNATADDVQALLRTRLAADDVRARTAIEKCWESYDYIGWQFFDAGGEEKSYQHAAAKEHVGRAVSEARRCDRGLEWAGLRPSPLARRSKYTVDIGIISTAMIDRIPDPNNN